MIRDLRDKFSAEASGVQVVWADAHRLRFRKDSFNIALSECAVCHFDSFTPCERWLDSLNPDAGQTFMICVVSS